MLLSIYLTIFSRLADWLQKHQSPCFYKKFLGVECPGCGMQRSLIALLKGDVVESFRLYPALLPMIFMLTYLILHLFLNFRNGALVLKFSFIFTSTIIVISFILKFI